MGTNAKGSKGNVMEEKGRERKDRELLDETEKSTAKGDGVFCRRGT